MCPHMVQVSEWPVQTGDGLGALCLQRRGHFLPGCFPRFHFKLPPPPPTQEGLWNESVPLLFLSCGVSVNTGSVGWGSEKLRSQDSSCTWILLFCSIWCAPKLFDETALSFPHSGQGSLEGPLSQDQRLALPSGESLPESAHCRRLWFPGTRFSNDLAINQSRQLFIVQCAPELERFFLNYSLEVSSK